MINIFLLDNTLFDANLEIHQAGKQIVTIDVTCSKNSYDSFYLRVERSFYNIRSKTLNRLTISSNVSFERMYKFYSKFIAWVENRRSLFEENNYLITNDAIKYIEIQHGRE